MSLISKLRRLRAWLPLVALVCLAGAVAPLFAEAGEAWRRADARLLVAAVAVTAIYRWLNAGVWSWVLESLGQKLGFRRAADLWLLSESLRWVPGGVWGFAARVESAHEAGVSRVAATASLVVELMITVVSWALLALIAGGGVWALLAGAAPVPVAAAFAAAGVLGLAGVFFFHRRPGHIGDGVRALVSAASLRPSALLRALAAYSVLNAVNGACFWLVLVALGHGESVDPSLAIASNAAGWLVGFFSFAVPGGVGVRELGSAALLATVMPWKEAAIAAFVWRLVQIVAELASVAPAALNKLRHGARPDAGAHSPVVHSAPDECESESRPRAA